jgi:hypothetical protein
MILTMRSDSGEFYLKLTVCFEFRSNFIGKAQYIFSGGLLIWLLLDSAKATAAITKIHTS